MKLSRATGTPGPVDSPSPSKKTKLSPGTSSLSEVADSPEAAPASAHPSPAKSDVSMSDAEENRPSHGRPPIPQQGFFPDPLAPDPVIYHIRDITPDMSDAEKKEIYSVTAYPTTDLSDQIAGVPPDKDFSNAKPSNQVAANTFLAYVEPYVRPLTEEDMAWLRERVSDPILDQIVRLIWYREIVSPHSYLYLEASVTTPRSGLRRMELCWWITAMTNFQPTNLEEMLNKSMTTTFQPIKSQPDLLQADSFHC